MRIVQFVMGVFMVMGMQLMLVSPVSAEVERADAYVFVREECSHCQALKAFVAENDALTDGYTIQNIDIATKDGRVLFNDATKALKVSKVTPIALVGGQVYVGFSEDVLGRALLEDAAKESSARVNLTLAEYMSGEERAQNTGGTCDEAGLVPCKVDTTPVPDSMIIPIVGEVDPQKVSLVMLASVLGFVDGFNPCAMWVLLTFLIILSQIGDRKKMIYIAGLFILAEAVMYYLILNVWYQTWDFIALDHIVTPMVAALALGSGVFFLWKWWDGRNKPLTCDVTSMEHQRSVEKKIQDIAKKPITFLGIFGVLGIAFSVNIIEFACSIGIPQAFTKVLELNELSFWGYQGYTLLYTAFYMVDDLIVFALAIWGYQKFYAVGQKYSHLSTLIAGVLMLVLGAILFFSPDVLSFM